jgi:hypothetical protein
LNLNPIPRPQGARTAQGDIFEDLLITDGGGAHRRGHRDLEVVGGGGIHRDIEVHGGGAHR